MEKYINTFLFLEDMAWRDYVDPMIKDHLEFQIKESAYHKEAINNAENKGNAQLWIAIANLSKQVFNLNLRIKYIEKLMKEFVEKVEERPKVQEDVEDVKEQLIALNQSTEDSRKVVKELEKELDANIKELKGLEKQEQIAKIKTGKKKTKKTISKKKK